MKIKKKLSHSQITSAGIQSGDIIIIIGRATVYQSNRALSKAE